MNSICSELIDACGGAGAEKGGATGAIVCANCGGAGATGGMGAVIGCMGGCIIMGCTIGAIPA